MGDPVNDSATLRFIVTEAMPAGAMAVLEVDPHTGRATARLYRAEIDALVPSERTSAPEGDR